MVRYFFILVLFQFLSAQAEYRVFELEITTFEEEEVDETTSAASVDKAKKAPPVETDKKYVLSNLDPEQYRGYHTILPNQRIRYVSTWRCPGRTSNKDYCPNPKVKTDDVSAAAPLETK